jgi:DNA-binding MarR family transcriptional regulator
MPIKSGGKIRLSGFLDAPENRALPSIRGSVMGVFAALRTTRAFRRRHLQFIETAEDQDLVLEIGYHQERGEPLSMKRLQLLGVTSVPTLQRRLRRLRQAGVVVIRRSENDGRAVELLLSPKALRAYAKYVELIRSIPFEVPAGSSEEPA